MQLPGGYDFWSHVRHNYGSRVDTIIRIFSNDLVVKCDRSRYSRRRA